MLKTIHKKNEKLEESITSVVKVVCIYEYTKREISFFSISYIYYKFWRDIDLFLEAGHRNEGRQKKYTEIINRGRYSVMHGAN